MDISGQPTESGDGATVVQACPNVVKQPARIEMMENEMAKLEKAAPLTTQFLLVAEFGQPYLVVRRAAGPPAAVIALSLHTSMLLRYGRISGAGGQADRRDARSSSRPRPRVVEIPSGLRHLSFASVQ